MAHSSDTYTASAGQTRFIITFELIDVDWVLVMINDVVQATTSYAVDATNSWITWSGSAINAGDVVMVYRESPVGVDDEPVSWEPGPVSDRDLALEQKKRRAHIEGVENAMRTQRILEKKMGNQLQDWDPKLDDSN